VQCGFDAGSRSFTARVSRLVGAVSRQARRNPRHCTGSTPVSYANRPVPLAASTRDAFDRCHSRERRAGGASRAAHNCQAGRRRAGGRASRWEARSKGERGDLARPSLLAPSGTGVDDVSESRGGNPGRVTLINLY